MSKLFAVSRMLNGLPDIDLVTTPVSGGYLLCGKAGIWGVYMFSGTGPELTAINNLSQVVGIVAVTESGDIRWAELEDVIPAGTRTKINTWLTARGYSTIPVGWTGRQVVQAIFKRLNDKFEIEAFDLLGT